MAGKIRTLLKNFYAMTVKFFRLISVIEGYGSFLRIRLKFPSSGLLVYDYSGIGDVYIFCGLIKARYNSIYGGNFVIVVTQKIQEKVIELFELKNHIVVNKQTAKNLTVFSLAARQTIGIKNITPFSRFNHTDISFRLGGVFFTMAGIYTYQMLRLDEGVLFRHPQARPDYQTIERLFSQKGLVPGKTALLSPYAKTCAAYSVHFWQCLAGELRKRGFIVCTNVSGNEEAIPETIPVFFSFQDAGEVLKRAGLFVALRSGLCDIVCNAECKKIILYPDYRMFNSSMYNFCSFEKMGMGRNIAEIQSPLGEEKNLLEKVLEKVDETARLNIAFLPGATIVKSRS